ncbi:hypothetical protein K438DRAFT_1754311 [Mycena galopus ATCC 62051]|nr:hypothetical protein K438DRAFT_1754311 [Mycena galopus ATCC 62051]
MFGSGGLGNHGRTIPYTAGILTGPYGIRYGPNRNRIEAREGLYGTVTGAYNRNRITVLYGYGGDPYPAGESAAIRLSNPKLETRSSFGPADDELGDAFTRGILRHPDPAPAADAQRGQLHYEHEQRHRVARRHQRGDGRRGIPRFCCQPIPLLRPPPSPTRKTRRAASARRGRAYVPRAGHPPHASLSKHAVAMYDLRHEKEAQMYGIGVKEAWRFEEKHVSAHETRLHFRALLANGTRLAYGARALTRGGLPRLDFPSWALVGCAAGVVNTDKINGTYDAMRRSTCQKNRAGFSTMIMGDGNAVSNNFSKSAVVWTVLSQQSSVKAQKKTAQA